MKCQVFCFILVDLKETHPARGREGWERRWGSKTGSYIYREEVRVEMGAKYQNRKKVNATIELQLIGPVKMSKCEKI